MLAQKHLRFAFLFAFGLMALIGCKAEEVELRVSTKQISAVIAGDVQEVMFQAEFNLFAEYDDEIKSTIKRVQKICEKYNDCGTFYEVENASMLRICERATTISW